MPYSPQYRAQVALLVRVLPFVAAETCFALKGGTAINLFYRNLPRLSVDIDLAYLPVAPRAESLADIDQAMRRIAGAIAAAIPGSQIKQGALAGDGSVIKLIVRERDVQIKIEVTPVLRGTVFPPEQRDVSPAVEDAFGFARMNVVSFADLFGGKLVAAFDRQHPRDLFDVRDLLANEGIDQALRCAFIVYLLCHNRPVAEVLSLRPKDIALEFSRGFAGMTDAPVSLEELLAARSAMKSAMVDSMPDDHRRFLISFEKGEPDWSQLGVDGVANLPAVQWREQNLASLPTKRRQQLVTSLEDVLARSG